LKRYFVEYLLVVVLLCGCTSPMTNRTVSTDSSTKISATNFVEQYKNIESFGIFEAMENDGDLLAGRFRYVRDINKKDFIQALSESKPIDRSETNINNSKLSFMVFADGSVFSYKYLTGESLIYDKKAKKYYLLPSKLSNIINQIEDKNMSSLYTLLYKDIPYSGIALAETINCRVSS
jgi:hypothetical protein